MRMAWMCRRVLHRMGARLLVFSIAPSVGSGHSKVQLAAWRHGRAVLQHTLSSEGRVFKEPAKHSADGRLCLLLSGRQKPASCGNRLRDCPVVIEHLVSGTMRTPLSLENAPASKHEYSFIPLRAGHLVVRWPSCAGV